MNGFDTEVGTWGRRSFSRGHTVLPEKFRYIYTLLWLSGCTDSTGRDGRGTCTCVCRRLEFFRKLCHTEGTGRRSTFDYMDAFRNFARSCTFGRSSAACGRQFPCLRHHSGRIYGPVPSTGHISPRDNVRCSDAADIPGTFGRCPRRFQYLPSMPQPCYFCHKDTFWVARADIHRSRPRGKLFRSCAVHRSTSVHIPSRTTNVTRSS